MAKTKIEWADAVWNPITGCSPVSEGCHNCYAKRMANRLRGWCGYPKDEPYKVTFHPDRLDQPLKWKKPRRIFVCSMGDLFHEGVKFNWVHEVWDIMKACPHHVFIVLTKRPGRMQVVVKHIYSLDRVGWVMDFWNHVWPGVTAENQKRADERIPT